MARSSKQPTETGSDRKHQTEPDFLATTDLTVAGIQKLTPLWAVSLGFSQITRQGPPLPSIASTSDVAKMLRVSHGIHAALGTLTHPDVVRTNQTRTTEFLLLGLSGQAEQEEALCGLFLCMYLVTIIGNLLIILAISCDPHLHTPMYFFLANLSSIDICFSSVTVPKMLVNHVVGSKSISYMQCTAQIYFFITFINMDGFLLSVMAYDRYVAICHPLHYSIIMRPRLCVLLVAVSWLITHLHALLHTLLMVQLNFCSNNTVHHFFCDLYAIIKLSCSDTFINELMVSVVGGLISITQFTFITVSYVYIFSNVLKFPSLQGIRKALSTCGSHLAVVFLFYGAALGVYMRPSSSYTIQDTVATVIFTVLTPLVNPFIYSLRNHDMKQAIQKLIIRRLVLS
ncbi:olfactory receptor 1f45-like [Erethizon dorsatum]